MLIQNTYLGTGKCKDFDISVHFKNYDRCQHCRVNQPTFTGIKIVLPIWFQWCCIRYEYLRRIHAVIADIKVIFRCDSYDSIYARTRADLFIQSVRRITRVFQSLFVHIFRIPMIISLCYMYFDSKILLLS